MALPGLRGTDTAQLDLKSTALNRRKDPQHEQAAVMPPVASHLLLGSDSNAIPPRLLARLVLLLLLKVD